MTLDLKTWSKLKKPYSAQDRSDEKEHMCTFQIEKESHIFHFLKVYYQSENSVERYTNIQRR